MTVFSVKSMQERELNGDTKKLKDEYATLVAIKHFNSTS